jgi:serine/threonine-protein phosphatase PGAM5
MAQYRKVFKTIFASASIVGTAVLVKNLISENKPLQASWTNNYEPSVKWDQNWDKREPSYLTKPKRHSSSTTLSSNADQNNNQQTNDHSNKTHDDSELNKHTSKARRHLFLIRHGQYHTNAKESHQMILTQLGKILFEVC